MPKRSLEQIYKSLFFIIFLLSFFSLKASEKLEDNNEEKRVFEIISNLKIKEEADYKKSAPELKKFADKNNPDAQNFYADICYRNLDEENHPYKEAALYYWLSAYNGNSEAFSYLNSIISDLSFDQDNLDEDLNKIVNRWAMDFTFDKLKGTKQKPVQVQPKKISGYYIKLLQREKNDENINVTKGNKIPYFFDKLVHTFSLLKGKSEKDSFDFCFMKNSEYEKESFTTKKPKPYRHGPFYGIETKDLKADDGREIPPLYKFLLETLYKETSESTASELVMGSHKEYPWIWAGLKFCSITKPDVLKKLSISVDEFLQDLEAFKRIPDEKVTRVVEFLEEENPFPDLSNYNFKENQEDQKIKENILDIEKEYKKLTLRFFRNPISVQSDFSEMLIKQLFPKIENLEVDYNKNEDQKILETPILMVYCKNLKLLNVVPKKNFYNALVEGQKWFVYLEFLNISYSNQYKKTAKVHELLQTLFKQIEKNGFFIKNEPLPL